MNEPRMSKRSHASNAAAMAVAAIAVTVTVTVTLIASTSNDDQPVGERHEHVAELGREVMPFDLEATTHHFTKTADGLRQTVVVDDGSDVTQIELIRGHLRAEAARFGRGDFGDPAAIHGDEMPGLAELRDHRGRLSVRYRNTVAGAELTYTSADDVIIEALHRWADAQVTDHGPHAETG